MSGEFSAALEAVRQYARGQGLDAGAHIAEDGADSLVFAWAVTDARAAILESDGVTEVGGILTLRLVVDGLLVVLISDSAGTWLPEERDPSEVLPHLADGAPRMVWTSAELVAGDSTSRAEISGACQLSFDKRPWRTSVESEVTRSVWIGATKAGFADWLMHTVPDRIAATLFRRAGALVLLDDWTKPAAGRGRLAIGRPDFRPLGVNDDGVLVARLTNRGESDLLPAWRLLDVDPRPQPLLVRVPMQRAIGLAAAGLVAQVRDGDRVRPSATKPTEWTLGSTPEAASGEFEAITALARWVGEDLSEARLQVARDLAARRIADPAQEAAVDPILRAARLAYTLHVEQDVRDSLEHQQKLEESFRTLDDSVAEMRSKLVDALDGALTKALAGALTITIASLTSAKVRDWPASVAGLVICAYLVISAVNVWHLRDESVRRLDEMAAFAGHRLEGLGDRLTSALEPWKSGIRRRAKYVLWILAVSAVSLLLGGILQNAKITGWSDGSSARSPIQTPR